MGNDMINETNNNMTIVLDNDMTNDICNNITFDIGNDMTNGICNIMTNDINNKMFHHICNKITNDMDNNTMTMVIEYYEHYYSRNEINIELGNLLFKNTKSLIILILLMRQKIERLLLFDQSPL